MNAKLKIFKGIEEAEDLERQVSTFLDKEVASLIKINIDSIKISKVVNMFEVEVDAYDCFLLYEPKNGQKEEEDVEDIPPLFKFSPSLY